MKNATLVQKLQNGRRGVVQRLYRMEPSHAGYSHVMVSATTICGRPETFLFGCNEKGEVLDYCELPGSTIGTLSHDKALANAGYEVAR